MTEAPKVFASTAPLYIEMGYHVLPLLPRQKRPAIKGHPKLSRTPPTPEAYAAWIEQQPGCGIGVVLGYSSGVCALDFDHVERKIVDEIMAAIVEPGYIADCRRVGKKNFSVFFRYNPEIDNTRRTWSIAGQTAVEFLSDERFLCLPPSIHPDTQEPYFWPTGCEPLYLKEKADLPLFPAKGFDIIEKIIGKYHEKEKRADYSKGATAPTLVREDNTFVRETSTLALAKLDLWVPTFFPDLKKKDDYYQGYPPYRPGSDNPTALAISPRGINDFSEYHFSTDQNDFVKGRKYTAPGILHRTYPKKFKSAFDAAKTLRKIVDPEFYIGANHLAAQIIETKGRTTSAKIREILAMDEPKFPYHLIDTAPNLFGEVLHFIIDSLRFQQPVLSVGAALTVIGGAIAQRLMTPTGIICNFFNIAIAPSSSGKEQVRQAIMNIFDYIGEEKLIMEYPASAPGLIKGLSNRDGEGILLIDEFGRELSRLTSRKASDYKSAMIDTIMKLSSLPYTPVVKKNDYALDREGLKDLYAPCLVSFNTTVGAPFYDALTSSNSVEGFLGRGLLWETDNPNPDPKTARTTLAQRPKPPISILKQIMALRNLPKYNPTDADEFRNQIIKEAGTRKNLVFPHKIIPAIVPITPEAQKVFDGLYLLAYDRKGKLLEEEKGLEALWGRMPEQAIKIALAASNFTCISLPEALWAAEMATYQAELRTFKAINFVADSDIEHTRKRILRSIKVHYKKNPRGIPCATLQRMWGGKLEVRHFNDALVHLLNTQEIQAVDKDTGEVIGFVPDRKSDIAFVPYL